MVIKNNSNTVIHKPNDLNFKYFRYSQIYAAEDVTVIVNKVAISRLILKIIIILLNILFEFMCIGDHIL